MFRKVCVFLIRAFLNVYFKINVVNVDRFEKLKSGCVITPNHIAMWETLIVPSNSKRVMYMMAKEELFKNKFVNWLLIHLKAFPIGRGKSDIGAIKKSIDTILLICGIVTVFLLLASIITNTFNFNSYNSMIIKGILEITIGIEALGKFGIPMIYKAVIASCFLAFGGFSVHMQVMSQLADTKIQYRYFFLGRIYQVIISGIITYVICLIAKI